MRKNRSVLFQSQSFLGFLPLSSVYVFGAVAVPGNATDVRCGLLDSVAIQAEGTTRAQGMWRNLLPPSASLLHFSIIGAAAKKAAVNNRIQINMGLVSAAASLQNTMTGCGTRKKSQAANAMFSLSGEKPGMVET